MLVIIKLPATRLLVKADDRVKVKEVVAPPTSATLPTILLTFIPVPFNVILLVNCVMLYPETSSIDTAISSPFAHVPPSVNVYVMPSSVSMSAIVTT
ncbi:hypothetical protein FACS189496_2500 [Bacilli bacterium]|nr:hypothetical protein FACS189496_2460 [Bacilli bacterium]GHU52410.1 hypothetical protein FACS189496_2500 [Bacilli bacterium]